MLDRTNRISRVNNEFYTTKRKVSNIVWMKREPTRFNSLFRSDQANASTEISIRWSRNPRKTLLREQKAHERRRVPSTRSIRHFWSSIFHATYTRNVRLANNRNEVAGDSCAFSREQFEEKSLRGNHFDVAQNPYYRDNPTPDEKADRGWASSKYAIRWPVSTAKFFLTPITPSLCVRLRKTIRSIFPCHSHVHFWYSFC